MNQNAEFSFSPDAIGHVLSDRTLAVPVYQRSYSWKDSQVEEYWSDLRSAFDQGAVEYFIGNLVLSADGAEPPDALAIIDGQQRLATTAIVLAAVRDEYAEREDHDVAKDIQDTFLSTYDRRQRESKPRLRLNSDDDPLFRRLVIEGVDADELEPLQGSHELLISAYEFLRGAVRDFAASAGDDWSDKLADWTDFLEEKVRVVVVDVPTESDAFLIFETLNDRGADLTIADLLKNYLFRRAGDDLDAVRDAWMSALGTLEMSAEDRVFTTFIRHLWSSKHGATRERLLYQSIKERITGRVQAVEFSQDLRRAARHYAAILNSSHDHWRQLGSKTKDNIETLDRLKLEQMRPILLALMQHFEDRELRRALKALVGWGVRGQVVGGIGGGKTERAYCEGAVAVRAGDVKNTEQLLDVLSQIVPSDEEFKSYFRRARVTIGRLARYYLHVLERVRRDEDEPELIPNQNAEEVNLEHVLPKNPEWEDWPQFTEEEHKIYVHRLGNMALLQRGPNDRLGNKGWKEKQPVLAASGLLLTSEAGGLEEWTRDAIDARQDELANLAVTAWPREVE